MPTLQGNPNISNKKELETIYAHRDAIGNAIKSNKKRKIKKAIATTTAILAAGATVITPVIVYRKKEAVYDISVQSEVKDFQAYTISVKRGTSITTLKNKLYAIDGHVLEGIYKDEACTILYQETDKVTANSKVYLKYVKEVYSVKMPTSKYFDILTSTAVNPEKIEWGDSFTFRIQLKDSHSQDTNITVKANGIELVSDNQGYYQVPFVQNNVVITVEGVDVNKYVLSPYPSQVSVTDYYGKKISAGSILSHGQQIKVSYKLSKNCIMSVFKVGDESVENDSTIVVTSDINITFEEVYKDLNANFSQTADGIGWQYYHVAVDKDSVEEVEIPSIVNNKNVVEIKEEAFKDYINLQQVTIPNTIQKIGDKAFENCEKLESITLPSDLTDIADNAFDGCDNLKEIRIPEGMKLASWKALSQLNSVTTLYVEDPEIFTQISATFPLNSIQQVSVPKVIDEKYSNVWLNANSLILEDEEKVYFHNKNNISTLTIGSTIKNVREPKFANPIPVKFLTIESETIYNSLKQFKLFSDAGFIDNLVEIKVNESIYNATHSLFNSSDILTFKEGVYYHHLKNCAPDVEYTSMLISSTEAYLSTADNEYHTLAYVTDDYTSTTVTLQEGCELIASKALTGTKIETINFVNSHNVEIQPNQDATEKYKLTYDLSNNKIFELLTLDGEFIQNGYQLTLNKLVSVKCVITENYGLSFQEVEWTFDGATYNGYEVIGWDPTNLTPEYIDVGDYYYTVIVPEYFNNKEVIGIGDFALSEYSIEDGRLIFDYNDNHYINTLSLPKSLKYIGKNSFAGSVCEINLNEGLLYIGSSFVDCAPIDIPSTVVEIGDHTFDWVWFDVLTMPSGLKKLGYLGADIQVETLIVPNFDATIEEIDESAFNCFYRGLGKAIIDSAKVYQHKTMYGLTYGCGSGAYLYVKKEVVDKYSNKILNNTNLFARTDNPKGMEGYVLFESKNVDNIEIPSQAYVLVKNSEKVNNSLSLYEYYGEELTIKLEEDYVWQCELYINGVFVHDGDTFILDENTVIDVDFLE